MPYSIAFSSHVLSTRTSTLKLLKGLEQKSVEKDQCRTDTCSFSYTEAMEQFPVLYDVDSDESPSTPCSIDQQSLVVAEGEVSGLQLTKAFKTRVEA
ncbi:hypothetical protein RDI58_014386 [Solanum bulbocastanum]|uniref:Uncharacterized protein n=1 Tax=Solanum bulbocastanum TaxID=147425 RepID=A0AAN8YBS8_SOLBU